MSSETPTKKTPCSTECVEHKTQKPILKFKKHSDDAVIPTRESSEAAGWDLSVTRLVKIMGDVFLFDTDLSVEPSPGYHTLIYPRSSISKTNWSLANSIGLIGGHPDQHFKVNPARHASALR